VVVGLGLLHKHTKKRTREKENRNTRSPMCDAEVQTASSAEEALSAHCSRCSARLALTRSLMRCDTRLGCGGCWKGSVEKCTVGYCGVPT
jgi:hypothetical protein